MQYGLLRWVPLGHDINDTLGGAIAHIITTTDDFLEMQINSTKVSNKSKLQDQKSVGCLPYSKNAVDESAL